MLLNDVLNFHQSYAPQHSHGDILGDGFLLQANPIYQKIRLFALEIGCEYVEAYPQYLLMPFHELGKIVESKRIPYVPSGRLLRELEQNRPQIFSTNDVHMPESYHLHEAAHVIAEHCFKKIRPRGPEERILKTILCESFANTVDALACVPAKDAVHLYFIQQNSYMRPQKKSMDAVARLTQAVGFRFVFMLTFLSYVHANFLAAPMSVKAVKELAAQFSVRLSAKLLKDCQILGVMAERLDPQFRAVTTANYLKLEGFSGEVYDLLNFPFMKVFAKNKGFPEAALHICEILEIR